MTKQTSRRRLLSGGAAAVATALAGCVAVSGRAVQADETETFETDDLESVAVSARSGRVTIRAEDRETVAVRRVTRAASESDAETIRLEADRTGDRLDLAVDREDGPFTVRIGPDPRMDLEVTVPEDCRVERVDVRNGTVDVAGVRGPTAVESRNGALDLRDVDGDLTARTRNGAIDVASVDGSLLAETRNGEIDVADVAGDAEIETRNGAVRVAGLEGDVDVVTRNGEVTLEVPSALDATIGVSTRNGDIDVDGIEDLTSTAGDSSFHGTAGDGERQLTIETRNGGVTVRGRD